MHPLIYSFYKKYFVDGGEEKRLTDTEGLDDGPDYSTDGTNPKNLFLMIIQIGLHIHRRIISGMFLLLILHTKSKAIYLVNTLLL